MRGANLGIIEKFGSFDCRIKLKIQSNLLFVSQHCIAMQKKSSISGGSPKTESSIFDKGALNYSRFSTFTALSLEKDECDDEPLTCPLFESFESQKDHEVYFLVQKLDKLLAWRESLADRILKTKDPIVDTTVSILREFGIILHIFYQNQRSGSVEMVGIKDIKRLHDAIGIIAKIIKMFPCKFIESLDWKYLTLCENVVTHESPEKEAPIDLLSGVIAMKRHFKDPERLRKHFLKVIFMKFLKKVGSVFGPEKVNDQKLAILNLDSEGINQTFNSLLNYLSSTEEQRKTSNIENTKEIVNLKEAIEALSSHA